MPLKFININSEVGVQKARCLWLTPIILATSEADIGSRFEASWANSSQDPISKNTQSKK
jgi:hypothetical protein